MDKNLKEFGDKVSAQEKGEAEAALAAARSAMESNDPTALKQSTERLSQAAMKIGEAMYKAQAADQAAGATAQAGGAGPGGAGPGGGPGAGPGAAGGANPDEKVVDAEFEEVDEKKKRSA